MNTARIPVLRLHPENYYKSEDIAEKINCTAIDSNIQYPLNTKTKEDDDFENAIASVITIPTGEIKRRFFYFCAGIGAFALAYIIWTMIIKVAN